MPYHAFSLKARPRRIPRWDRWTGPEVESKGNAMKTEMKTAKARKVSATELAARAAAAETAAKATKAKTDAKATKAPPTLTLEQSKAETAMIAAARAVDGSTRKAAVAIANAYGLGLHAAYGVTLPEYITKTLLGADIAKATAYYLKDIGTAYAALGTARANLFPMEGLRAIASAAKGERARIEAMATDAQSGDENAKPSLENCRKAAKGTGSGLDRDGMVKALASKALKYAEKDADAALALLESAMDRITAAKAAADAAGEDDAED
jgi:hypothetical protein